jgi:murein DD-endopeptidase MepM/ murein hydrolase activator NlpD
MTISIRRLALGVIAAAVLAPEVILPIPRAEANPPTEATQFVIKAFPHETAIVRFSDTWGAPRSGGRRHKGTDIMSPKGTWVVAVDDGIVERLEWNRLSGWNIMIRHADGWTSHYLHLNNDTTGTDDGQGGPEAAFAEGLEVGSFVKAGEVIGFVGDSGNAEHSGSHTHFELHVDGRKVNPYPFLEEAMERKVRESEVQRELQ